jgi:hypothetical protein
MWARSLVRQAVGSCWQPEWLPARLIAGAATLSGGGAVLRPVSRLGNVRTAAIMKRVPSCSSTGSAPRIGAGSAASWLTTYLQ